MHSALWLLAITFFIFPAQHVIGSLGQPANATAPDIEAIRDFYRSGLARNGIVGSTLVLFDRDGHPGWQNGFRSQLNFEPIARRGYLVVYNTDAQDANQNTRRFNIELRDYLIGHFFASGETTAQIM